ncbi:MAG TPA: hypothetical protein QF469_06505 [Sphingomonas sanguinis]|uniref:hypothetical protein n=1 Tax=Sphingomonas sanguinis TaxID=33051 RepID=UPI002ABF3FA2|nr:hypothetical protein [Sphingomonas sanguinis]
MTRAANGAQRSGAAALIITFAPRHEDCASPVFYFASSFFVAPTPARRYQGRIGAGWGLPGSTVLSGPGGRTAKHLKYNGSTVLFRTLTRDACAGMCAHARVKDHQNRRTQNSTYKTYTIQWFNGSVPVLGFSGGSRAATQAIEPSWFSGSAGNKQWGGYCLTDFAGAGGAYPGLDRGTAARNFRGRARLAAGGVGAVDADRCGDQAAGKNGGFPPFFEGAAGRVGMAVSERTGKTVVGQCFAMPCRQPARLWAASGGAAWAAPLTPRGGVDGRQGGTPPKPRATFIRPMAQPIFWISSQFQIRRDAQADVVTGNGCLSSSAKTGSGVSILILAALTRGAEAAKSEWAGRVGEDRKVLGWGRSRTATLWGEVARVN